jgi:hypothetical protein
MVIVADRAALKLASTAKLKVPDPFPVAPLGIVIQL